jgi:hypothetical protein
MKRHLEPKNIVAQIAPTCWQREAPSACLRVELTGAEAYLFPYQQLVAASLMHAEGTDTLTLMFASHEVVFSGRSLRKIAGSDLGYFKNTIYVFRK